jgi:phospholipid/cholesterol/gamma-HCH transport system substrate-binding protein
MTPSFRWVAVKLGVFTVVTAIVTVWLAGVIGNFSPFTSSYLVRAEFSDATGLLIGDVVKAAGVDVGRVSDIQLDDGLAIVTMEMEEGTQIPADVNARIRFRNLIGQRMISLVQEGEASGDLLADDQLIPLARTDPAFDLTVLFNGLRPLIRSTSPRDINIVSRAVTQALEGRTTDVAAFLDHVAAISNTLASKDQQLGELLTNLDVVAEDLSGRDAQLRAILTDINDFFGDLDETRDELSAALITLDDAATRLRRLVRVNGDNIRAEVRDLAIILDAVDDKRADLRAAVRALPEMLVAVERVNSYGQWGNLHLIHVCKDDLDVCGRSGR